MASVTGSSKENPPLSGFESTAPGSQYSSGKKLWLPFGRTDISVLENSRSQYLQFIIEGELSSMVSGDMAVSLPKTGVSTKHVFKIKIFRIFIISILVHECIITAGKPR
jgi:hypothetical protein